MGYIEPEIIEKIKHIDLLTYLQQTAPGEVVRINDHSYTTRTHDSLIISNGMWMWFSRGIGGHNALMYLMRCKNMSFYDAANELLNMSPALDIENMAIKEYQKITSLPFLLPEKAESNDKVISYLLSRGISKNVIDYCIDKGLIYQRKYNDSFVFIGKDYSGTPRYAGVREINGSSFRGDITGSNKSYSFHLTSSESDSLHIFEGVTDLLSFATLLEEQGEDFRKYNLLALSGIYSPINPEQNVKVPLAISEFSNHFKISNIHLHLDNDAPGRNAAFSLKKTLSESFNVYDEPPEYGKDVNEYLLQKNERSLNQTNEVQSKHYPVKD